MKTLFITATSTDTGKTYVTAALSQALSAKGRSVRVQKPIISGFDESDFQDTDTAVLLNSAGLSATKKAVEAT